MINRWMKGALERARRESGRIRLAMSETEGENFRRQGL